MIFVIGFVGLFLFILIGGLIMGSNERNAAEEQNIVIKCTLDGLGIQSKKEYEEYETRVVRNAIQPLLNLGINFCDLTRTSSSLGICAYTQNRVYTSLSVESDADCKTEPIEYILGFQDYANRVDYLNIVGYLYENENLDLNKLTNDDISTFRKHIELLEIWENANFKMGLYRAIPESEIAYYRVIGDRQYISQVHGGGANIGNAIVGGVVAGDAGAIIGSRVGTEVKTDIQEKDNRRLFVYLKSYGGVEAEEIYTQNIDDVMDILRVWLPQKDYEYVSVFGTNNLANQNGDNTIHHNNSSVDELREYKELMDLGVISREEYERKRKSL